MTKTPEPPSITSDKAWLGDQLDQQIQKGETLRDAYESMLDEFGGDVEFASLDSWHDYNKTLLEGSFSNNRVLQDYEARSGVVFHTSRVPHDDRLTRLKSVRERLDLYEVRSESADAEGTSATAEPSAAAPATNPVVFIGHGGPSEEWKALRDFIHEKLGHKVIHFDSIPAAGYTVKERVMDMLAEATMAFIVMSAADEQAAKGEEGGVMRARQNVIHEAGLFQGKLGWKKAILVVEEGVERFSNGSGVTEIRYDPGQIEAKFGEVAATIQREELRRVAALGNSVGSRWSSPAPGV